MKLRSRTKTSTSDSPSVTATRPFLPPNITTLQTPPISELSNAGSTIARRERLSELSSSMMDVSDTEEMIPSVRPTKNRSKPIMTAPAAPLTTKNLAMHQEEISSAVEHASENGLSFESPTSNTRMTQARNYLLTNDINSDHEFKKRYSQIAEYLHNHKHEKGREEVSQLLKRHIPHVAASKKPTPRQTPPAAKDSSQSKIPTPAENHQDPQKKADPFKWTNKLDDLTKRVQQTPSGRKGAFAITNLQELARPLNNGRLPSPVQAYRLIDQQMTHEFREEDQTMNDADRDDDDKSWDFENRNLSSASASSSSDDLSQEEAETPALKLGQGTFMPREIKDVDWARDRRKLEDTLVGYDDVNKGEAQLLLAETPLLQALMSEQIESDLASKVKKGHPTVSPPRKPALLMTQKFALPRPPLSRLDESAAIAKSLNIRPDEPAAFSPRTAKRKFEQESDDEDEEDDGEIPEETVGSGSGGDGQLVFGDERVLARDPLVDGEGGGDVVMSGALQDL